MMTNCESQKYGMAAIAFGLMGTAIYLLMVNVTLAHIWAISDQIPFDMRPFGYTPEDAAQLLGSLGAKGRKYYLTRQIPLDTIYPALLAMALMSAMHWFGSRRANRILIEVGTVLSVGAAVFDYAENIGIVAMILNWPDVSDVLVYATSAASIAKSITTTVAVSLLILIGINWARRPKQNLATKHDDPTQCKLND